MVDDEENERGPTEKIITWVQVIPRPLRLCEFWQQVLSASSVAEIESNLHNVNEIEQCAGTQKMLNKIHIS
jgi:hypothetical protein